MTGECLLYSLASSKLFYVTAWRKHESLSLKLSLSNHKDVKASCSPTRETNGHLILGGDWTRRTVQNNITPSSSQCRNNSSPRERSQALCQPCSYVNHR